MKHFTSLADVDDPQKLVEEVITWKNQPANPDFAKGFSLVLLFFNPSLRTRLSSQRAAQLLGMDSMVLDVGSSWPLEFDLGTVMDQNKSEHIKEAAAVISQYADIIGIRSFPTLENRDLDYSEPVIEAFKKYGDRPVVNLESGTGHPLQGLADMTTIREHRKTERPRVLLTWAPHPRALPQSVPNSFAEWTLAQDYDLVIAHPEGYDLDPRFTQGATIMHDPDTAYEGVDFVYAKNWSSYQEYGKILDRNPTWMVDAKKMSKTNNAFFMHCLPVRRNVVVADDVIDSKQSLVIQQSNNRTFAAMAVLRNIITNINT
ncbi:MAG: N-acetylornithine carbamoyltransferase [Saprospiraceae bacterium]|nr:N-acetylornithine carbamoyltransferase [Saprospiraceae bacterium]